MLPQHCKSKLARRKGDVLGAAQARPPSDLEKKILGRLGQKRGFERVAAFGLDGGANPASDHFVMARLKRGAGAENTVENGRSPKNRVARPQVAPRKARGRTACPADSSALLRAISMFG